MRRSIVGTLVRGGLVRQPDRLAGHLGFGQRAAPGYLLDCVAVTIAGGEVHLAINSARILAQYRLHDAHGLDELAPVEIAEKAQTADAVADGDLIGGLLLDFRLHQLLDFQPIFRETLLDPGQRQR